MTEDDWVCRLQCQGPERDLAIDELRQILERGLTAGLRNRYGGDAIVEDVAQEAILKILSSLDTFQSRSRFTTWALSIAIRMGISELRRRHYRNRAQDWDVDALESSLSLQRVTTKAHAAVYVLEQLQECIDRELTPRQRTAIRGVLEGLPIEIIAQRLASNRNAIYKLVHDARLKLRLALERRGVTARDLDESADNNALWDASDND